MMPLPSWLTRAMLAGTVLVGPVAPLEAQQSAPVSVGVFAGHGGYIDEVWQNRVVAGGLVRRALTPRLAIGPEVMYLHGPDEEREWLVAGTLSYDLAAPSAGRRVVPFLVAGAGVARLSSLVGRGPNTPGLQRYWATDATVSGGLGVRVSIAPRIFLSGEARLGFVPERRLTIGLGWTL